MYYNVYWNMRVWCLEADLEYDLDFSIKSFYLILESVENFELIEKFV